MKLIPRIVGAVFLAAVIALGVASWDVARGRVPETRSALLLDVLESPDDRICTRDASAIAARHIKPGMSRAEALDVLGKATVVPPKPLFWTVKPQDALADQGASIAFTRVARYTAFGNHVLTGAVALEGDAVRSVSARSICPFN